jgi:two-component system, chemotaxis family, sensor kinase Cph1
MVASFTELLARRYKGRLDKDADNFIDFAVSGANRMKQLINDLLDYSGVGTRVKPFRLTDCRLALDNAISTLTITISILTFQGKTEEKC